MRGYIRRGWGSEKITPHGENIEADKFVRSKE
jgi:hypothetical protein